VVGAMVGGGVLLLRGNSGTSVQLGVTTYATTSQAVSWTVTNLPHTVPLLADEAARGQLLVAGYPAAEVDTLGPAASSRGRARYLIVTPGVRAAASQPGSPTAQLLATALPVAVFGSGQTRVEVSQLDAMGEDLSVARQARVVAGAALLRNPGVRIPSALAPIASEGRLDLRAATLLAVLAARGQVVLSALSQDPSEALAGAPVRSIEFGLTAGGGGQAVAATVQALPGQFRPQQLQAQPDGSFRIVWLPDLSLTPPVS
jgi:hypothetical protein